MNLKSLPLAAILLLTCTLQADLGAAVTAMPSWASEPTVTRTRYIFDTNSTNPAANDLENSYGTPVAQLSLGAYNDGWQSPSVQIDLNGASGDGAWDLGDAGTFTVSIPVALPPASNQSYRIDFVVTAVAYQGLSPVPLFTTVGDLPDELAFSKTLYASDPDIGFGSWQLVTWEGAFTSTSANSIDFQLVTPPNPLAGRSQTSVLDEVEILTRYTLIPEPSCAFLLLSAGVFTCLLRRRDGAI